MYNKRKFGQPYQADLKRLSKELVIAKKKDQETFLRSYKTKVDAGQNSISMLDDVKEIQKIFWRSRTIMASISQIQ